MIQKINSNSDFKESSLNIILFLTIILSCGITNAQITHYSNPVGDGSVSNPIQIYTANDLIYLSKTSADWGKYFKQMASIDFGSAQSVDWDNDGSATWDSEDQLGFSPIGNDIACFSGSYDGNNYIIRRLFINRSNTIKVGFFGYTQKVDMYQPYKEIKNIGLLDCNITGYDYVGCLVGQAVCYVNNCFAYGTVKGNNWVGGLIGSGLLNIGGCYAVVDVSGGEVIGGLLGGSYGPVVNSFASGSAIGTGNSIGGLIGRNFESVSNSYANGAVIGNNTYFYYSGGLVGANFANVTNCYATGSVTGSGTSGGLIGFTDTQKHIITSSYYDEQTSEKIDTGNGKGYLTDDFSSASNFSGWSSSYWTFDIKGRPYLNWQKAAVSNSVIIRDSLFGHVVNSGGITIAEAGVRYTQVGSPINWIYKKASSNTNIGINIKSLVSTIGSDYYVQAYAKDNNNMLYFGDMIRCAIYRITYNPNGGITGSQTEELVSKWGNPLMPDSVLPTRSGYSLNGWNTLANGTGTTITKSSIIKSHLTLYAKWTPNYYDVIFDANTGAGTMPNQAIAYNSSKTLSINTFTKADYLFAGWSTSKGGSISYADGANYSMKTAGDVTLYAVWKPDVYDIIFDANTGTGKMPNQTVTFNKATPLNKNTFTKPGYSFAFWATSKNLTFANFFPDGSDFTILSRGNDTLYATWKLAKYDIIFDANSGEGSMPNQTITYSSTDTLYRNTFIKSGYKFAGWSLSKNSGIAYTDAAIFTMKSTSNITLFAVWTIVNDIPTAETKIITVYPNPARDLITIKRTSEAPVEIKVFDLNGSLLIEKNISDGIINIQNLIPGVYVLVVGDSHIMLVKQ